MNYLFSYGTFRSLYVQGRLFGRTVATKPAKLLDYAVFTGKDGYHGLLPCKGSAVSGSLLTLTDRELEIADGWEICPTLYYRQELELHTDECLLTHGWVYLRTDPQILENQVEDDNLLFTLSQAELDQELDEYTKELKANGLLR